MDQNTAFYLFGGVFIAVIVLGVLRDMTVNKRYQKPMPEKPQPPNSQREYVPSKFDAISLQNATEIMQTLKQYPDENSRMLALADSIHNLRSREQKAQERQIAQEGREFETLDRIGKFIGMIMPREAPREYREPNRERRINGDRYRAETFTGYDSYGNPTYYREGRWND